MKKAPKRFLFLLVCSAMVPLLIPSYGAAFQTIKWGEDNELSVYGFLRNDLGMFTNTLPQGANGNKLAGARTTLRGYGDLKFGEHFKVHVVAQLVWEPPYPVERGATSSRVIYTSSILHGGKEYSEYKNINDLLREAYVEWKPNNFHDIRAGRQIVIWGESLTDMVLDVVHPPYLRTGFFVGNQEDARIPQWILRGIHQIPALRSSFEWVINPLFVGSMYRVGWVGMTGERFAQYPEDRTSRWPFIPSAAFLPDNVLVKYPNSLKDLRYGFRTTTMTESTQFGFVYWHTQSYSPVMKWGVVYPIPLPPPLSVRHMDLTFPNYDIFGLYGNMQLSSVPGVVRAEIAYSPNKSFNTFNVDRNDSGAVRRNWLKYMIAYDLAGYFYFSSWHPTAPFDITIEHVGEWIPNAHHYDLEFSSYNTNLQTYTASFNMRIGTSWLYGKFTTDFIVGYSTFGNSGLLLPHIGYVPGWFDKKLTFDLKYYRIYGESYYEGMGIMKGKNLLMLTTQFSF